jgi:fructokinase
MRIGVDLGGTKIEVVALDAAGTPVLRRRTPTPGTYEGVMEAIAGLVEGVEADLGARATVGIGMPGSLSPVTGFVRNANSTFLNGRPLAQDLSARLGRPLRFSNDANCLALSEAADGAAAGERVVFAVIIGTGCGGGVVVDGKLVEGLNGIGGEWGHNPLPWMTRDEFPGHRCWCGQLGCQEVFLSGPGIARDVDGEGARDASSVAARAAAGDAAARAGLARHADRLARAFAAVINLLDPDVIVLGGGVSNMPHCTEEMPALLPRHVFSDVVRTRIVRAKHGDSSGVLGAARLWD